MTDFLMPNAHAFLESAALSLSDQWKLPVRFSEVMQLSLPDRRNLILRLTLDHSSSALPRTLFPFP